ncbi:AraC-type DNA-binding protein [Butyrivibrio sp. ob235]|uniref:AraC family transcriptional regulator n=1 Tax=unclassified Butyrivibrio TaxID=2639466 RepID=UPI0003B30B2A|nr:MULTISPECIES: AraC family transcriptional regulator [unclassified Butyrivibrio]SEL20268.1 AraC-type DNA-binding protein [Butyrivibrio sp. ob235]
MKPLFESFEDDIEIYKRANIHTPPHLHGFIEFIYISKGTMEIGVGQELYHMEKGDMAVIFPGQIQHTQVFDTEKGTGLYLIASPSYAGSISDTLLKKVPVCPVIKSSNIHKEIQFAFNALYEEIAKNKEKGRDIDASSKVLYQSYISIILLRSLPVLKLTERDEKGNGDLIYRTVSYIASNFTKEISLTSMAKDLYVSPFALSRVFSGTFHTNFNRYLNETRFIYAQSLLRYTDQTITEVYENAGFESQRTFNRVFTEKLHMSPREYRKIIRQDLENSTDELFVSTMGTKDD